MIGWNTQFSSISEGSLKRLLLLFDAPEAHTQVDSWLNKVIKIEKEDDLPSRDSSALILIQEDDYLLHYRWDKGSDEQSSEIHLVKRAKERVDSTTLKKIRQRENYRFVAMTSANVLFSILETIEAKYNFKTNAPKDWYSLLLYLQNEEGKSFFIDPPVATQIKIPSFELLKRTIDKMWPDGKTQALFLFDGRNLWTSVIAKKEKGELSLVTSASALKQQAMSIKDMPKVQNEITRRFGELHLCLALDLATWNLFIKGDRSAIAQALIARRAYLDPAPKWFRLMIGAGAISEAATRSAKVASKLLSRSPLGAFLGEKSEAIVEKLANPLEAIGIDPWELIQFMRSWSRRVLPLIIENGDQS